MQSKESDPHLLPLVIVCGVSLMIAGLAALIFQTDGIDASENTPLPLPSPTITPTHVQRAESALVSGDYQVALISYTQAIEQAPDDAALYARRANAYLAVNAWTEAASDFEQALQLTRRLSNEGWLVSYQQGEIARSEGKLHEAFDHFTRAIELSPMNFRPYYQRAELLNSAGYKQEAQADYRNALETLSLVIETGDEAPENYRLRAQILEKLGRYRRASADWLKVLGIRPDDLQSYRDVGEHYIRLGDYTTALPHYEHILQHEPQNPQIYGDLGWLYFHLNDYEQAIAYYDLALSLNPDQPQRRLGRADAYLLTRRYEQAIADYTTLIQSMPEKAYSRRAWVHMLVDDKTQALNDYMQHLSLHSVQTHPFLSFFAPAIELNIHFQEDDTTEYIDFYAQILTINPHDQITAQNLGELLAVRGQAAFHAGDYDAAIRDFERVRQLNPDSLLFEPDHALAMVYYRRAQQQNTTDEMLNDYLQVAGLGYYLPDVALTVADLFYTRGDYTNALSYYEYYAGSVDNSPVYVSQRITEIRAD